MLNCFESNKYYEYKCFKYFNIDHMSPYIQCILHMHYGIDQLHIVCICFWNLDYDGITCRLTKRPLQSCQHLSSLHEWSSEAWCKAPSFCLSDEGMCKRFQLLWQCSFPLLRLHYNLKLNIAWIRPLTCSVQLDWLSILFLIQMASLKQYWWSYMCTLEPLHSHLPRSTTIAILGRIENPPLLQRPKVFH